MDNRAEQESQNLIPTLSQSLSEDRYSSRQPYVDEISVEEDQDYDIEDIARLPFRIAKVLGGGHSAIVEKVHDTKTGKIFAKKTIRFPQARLKKQKEEHFKNEVNIIRSLKNHHHIIRIFATYVAKREFGLILQPAADEGSLEDYLGNYWDKLEQPGPAKEDVDLVVPVLEKAFGCLASGLAYIHGKGVRHKDIKPQNILVHRGSILYTDFGSSKDANQPGESTTEGLPDFLTRKYSPPEVLAHTKRNYGADIYSLGCVYVELIKALIPNINYDEGRWFSDIMEHVHQELSSAVIPSRWSFIPTIIRAMTRTDREQRPVASRVYSLISGHAGFLCAECYKRSETKPESIGSASHARIRSPLQSMANSISPRSPFHEEVQRKNIKPTKGILKPPTKLFPFMEEGNSADDQSPYSSKRSFPRPLPPDDAPHSLSLFGNEIMNHEFLREEAQWIFSKFTNAVTEFVDQVGEVEQARLVVQEKRQDLKSLNNRVSEYDMMLMNNVRNFIFGTTPLEEKRLIELAEAAKDARDLLDPFDLEYAHLELELGAKEYKLKGKFAQIEESFQRFFRLTVNPSPPQSIPSKIDYEESSSISSNSPASNYKKWESTEPQRPELFHEAFVRARKHQLKNAFSSQNGFRRSEGIGRVATKSQSQDEISNDPLDVDEIRTDEPAATQSSEMRRQRLRQDLIGVASHIVLESVTDPKPLPHKLFDDVDLQETDQLLLHGAERHIRTQLSGYLTTYNDKEERIDRWMLHKLRVSRGEVYAFRRYAMNLAHDVPKIVSE